MFKGNEFDFKLREAKRLMGLKYCQHKVDGS